MTKQSRLAKSGGIALASSLLIMGLLPAVGAFAATAPNVQLSESAKTVAVGGSDTFTATASGITNPVYQFWVQQGNTWTMARGWSSSNSYTLNNMQDGSALVTAYAAPKGDLSAATNTAPNGNEDTAAAFVDSSVTVSGPSTVVEGQTVTLTATATNVSPALYQFWYETPAGTWVQSGNYGTSNTDTFTATQTGTYHYIAYAKMPDAINNSLGAEYSTASTLTSNVSTPSLSALTVSGNTAGTGSESNPATSLNSANITASTTLTDASGNPIPNTQVTFNVSEYGKYPTGMALPTVTNASGTVIAGTSGTNAEEYTAFTNASGVASLTFAGPSGETYAYEIQATAPYSNTTGTLSSAPAYLEFVTNNEAGISPLAESSTQAFTASMGTAVPITIAVPPTASGTAQSNALVTLSTAGIAGAADGASFVNASGQVLGSTIQVATNAAGIATTMLSDSTAQIVSVTATLPATLGITNPPTTYISFEQAGVGSKIENFGITDTSGVPANQNVVLSGELEDSAGNPVPNGQILVSGNDNLDSEDFGTVSTSGVVTDFPTVSNPLTAGTPATSAYGTVVTANSAGNFSFAVTDTDGVNLTATYYMYGVADGDVTTVLQSGTIGFVPSTTLNDITVAGTENGLTTLADSMSSTGVAYGITPVWFEPQNVANNPLNQSTTYDLSVGNGGKISTINGVTLPNRVAGLTLEETYTAGSTTGYDGSGYTITVPGENVTIPVFNTTQTAANQLNSGTSPMDIEVGVYNKNAGATNLTITSGSVNASATIDYNGGSLDETGAASPSSAAINPGQTQTVSMTVEDANGNPVSDVAVPVSLYTTGTAGENMFLTSVNGVSLESSEYFNSATTTEPTPVPLFEASLLGTPSSLASNGANTVAGALGYTAVTVPGVFSWSGGNSATVYSNASGLVTFTLQAGNSTYYDDDSATGGVETSAAVSTGTTEYLGYNFPSNVFTLQFGATSANVDNQQSSISVGAVASPFTSATVNALSLSQGVTTATFTGTASNGTANQNGSLYVSVYSGTTLEGTVTPATVTNGAWSAAYTLPLLPVGSYTVDLAASNGGATIGTGTLTITPAVSNTSTVALSATSVTAGTPLTVYGTVKNTAGDVVSGATVDLEFDGQSATTTTGSTGTYVVSVKPTTAISSSPVTVTANGVTISSSSNTASVTAAAESQVVLAPSTYTEVKGTGHAFTASLEDKYGNVITTNSTNSVTFTLTPGSTPDGAGLSTSSTYAAPASTPVLTETVTAVDGVATVYVDAPAALVSGSSASLSAKDTTASITSNTASITD